MLKQSKRGGPNRNQGRHKEPGYQILVSLRFLTKTEEEELKAKKLTPRQRVEILLAYEVEENVPKTT